MRWDLILPWTVIVIGVLVGVLVHKVDQRRHTVDAEEMARRERLRRAMEGE